MSQIHEAWKAYVTESIQPPEKSASAAGRQALLLEGLSRRMDQALHAITYLSAIGAAIESIEIKPTAARVRVAHTPMLAKVFAADMSWRQRRTIGTRTVYTWFVIRFDTRIEWEED